MTEMRLSAAAPGCEPSTFAFNDTQLRIFDRKGILWFVAKDVVVGLELSNTALALRALDKDERGLQIVTTPGGPQEMVIISEPGFYKLVGRSRKPAARHFDRWVRHEVLPAIRKTGGYQAAPAVDGRRINELIAIVGQFVVNQKFVTEDRFNHLVAVVDKMADAIAKIADERETEPQIVEDPKRITRDQKDHWQETVLEWADARIEPFRLIDMFPDLAFEHRESKDLSRRARELRIARILRAHGYEKRGMKPKGRMNSVYWEKVDA